MNVKQLNRIFARAMYGMAIVAVVMSVYATPVAADNKTPVGEKIRIRDDWMSYPMDTPFHISHGWVQLSDDGAIGVFDFKLDVDGIPREEDYKDFSVESGEPDILTRIWVFNFPDGMAGEHTFTGHWFAPCQYAVDWLDYPGPCKKPNEKVETYTATLTVSFNLPTFVAYKPGAIEGYDWPVGDLITININYDEYTAQAISEQAPDAPEGVTRVLFELWRDDFFIEADDYIVMTNGDFTKDVVVTNLAVTDIDVSTFTVSGIYDPMYNLWTWLYDLEGQVPVMDPDTGTWISTFSELPSGAWGGATQWDEDGDGTSIDFQVPNTRFTVWPEWNYLEGYEWPEGVDVSISVSDKEACSTDATSAFPEWDPWNTFFSVNFPEDCDIGMGDFVTLSYGMLSLTHQIQELTITDVNLEFDTVIGTAAFDPEQYLLHTWIHDVDGSYMQLSAEDGNWLSDFGYLGFDLQPGMGGRVELVDQASNATAVDWHIPLPSFAAYMPSTIEGYDWPMGHTIALNINDGEYTALAISEQRPDFPDGETRVLFELWMDEFSMKTGDHILMTDEALNFTKELYVADLQVTAFNLVDKTVSGFYDPDRSFWTQLDGQDPVDIIFNGNTWVAAFPDMLPGTWGYVAQDDDDHDGTVWDFQVPDTYVAIANQPDWVDAGIFITAGKPFTVEAFGLMNPCSDTYPNGSEICIFYTPVGGEWAVPYENDFGIFPGPGLPFMALLGRIGDGEPFYVGAGDTFIAEQDGMLWLTPNDNLRTDNQGVYSVLVWLE